MALAGSLLASPALFAPPAMAHHFSGEVQLWVSTMDFRDSPDGVLVSVKLIERSSGESVSGFGVRVSATGSGNLVGPIELQETEFAVYTGVLRLSPGRWEILATAHQGTSSLPAIESAQSKTLEIDAAGRLLLSSGNGSGVSTTLAIVLPIIAIVALLLVVMRRRRLSQGAGAILLLILPILLTVGVGGSVAAQDDDTNRGDTNRGIGGYYEPRGLVTVVLEDDPVGYEALSPNFVPLIARLFDPETNEPVGLDYVVLASLTDIAGRRGTVVHEFGYPYLYNPAEEPVGVYKGTVIVPAPGRWTVVVNVFDPIDEAESEVPTSLGHAELVINVTDARTLLSAAEFGEVSELPSANPGEVILLTVHSIFGVLWFAVALALACISSPNRAKWFSIRTNDFLERNLNQLVRTAIAVTFIIWLTGILNLNMLVAYPPPLSANQARSLFTLPYAQPYTISLYLKIAIYSGLTLLLIPLTRAARRSAEGVSRPDRWAGLRHRSWGTKTARTAQPPGVRQRLFTVPKVSFATIGLGGVVIVVCVTILKYTHILSESIGSLTP